MATVISGTSGVNTSNITTQSINFGLVGDRRNMYSSTSSPSSNTASFTADMHILGDSTGKLLATSLPSRTIDVTVIGVGGFLTTPTPASWVAVYHIYNQASNTSSLVGVQVSLASLVPEMMSNDIIPSGYTYSALAAILPIDDSGKFRVFTLNDRHISSPVGALVNRTGVLTNAVIDLSTVVPLNFKSMDVTVNLGATPSLPSSGWSLYFQFVGTDSSGSTTGARSEVAFLGTGLPTSSPSGVIGSSVIWTSRSRKYLATTGPALSSGQQVSGVYLHGYTF